MELERLSAVPIRYTIQGVEDFDVIAFPSTDQVNVKILDYLQALSHLAMFVVDYRYISTSINV